METLTREQIRRLDRLAIEQYGVPGIVLMENAGRGVVETMCSLDIDGSVAILVGPGNNGGDGFVMARHLDQLGHEVCLVSCCEPERWKGDALTNYRIVCASGMQVHRFDGSEESVARIGSYFENAAWIVDAILGTGATGALRSPLDQLVRLANESTARRLAVDLPSGLDCDTGEPSVPTFEADHTCTFVALKPGLVADLASSFVGELHVIGIGAPRRLIESLLNETQAGW